MAKLKIQFRCEAAGRKNNEDNGKVLHLGNKGELLVVCDGMGGMEAGEVASALAVATIEQWFAPERLTPQVLANPQGYLKQSIVGADTNIKNYTKSHPETEGMGSTVVMAWLMDKKIYVAWCGDSRAYRYNTQLGLERLSHDHSLVQTWVDAGQITEDQAFDHPQSNIITRSLGDPNGVAMPDSAEYELYNDDVILLCSDGLCGTLRDREIESIIADSTDLKQCCDMLWKADEAAGWHDNVTTAMAQVVAGGAMLSMAQAASVPNSEMEIVEEPQEEDKPLTRSKYLQYVGIAALFVLIAGATYYFAKPSKNQPAKPEKPQTEQTAKTDKGNINKSEEKPEDYLVSQPEENSVEEQENQTIGKPEDHLIEPVDNEADDKEKQKLEKNEKKQKLEKTEEKQKPEEVEASKKEPEPAKTDSEKKQEKSDDTKQE